MIRSFNEMHLSAPMLDAIARAGYTSPTPLQPRAIGIALEGKDLIGCAQTGTGKTAAFAIPIIERLCASRPGAGARALVLAPTRELALQIAETFALLGGARGIRTVTLIGGEAMGPQLAGLARRPDVIVATPGRLFDHLERRSATLSSVRIVVLDEADRMLDMGFAPQVERILAVTPLDRQTLCFSATMPEEVERLVRHRRAGNRARGQLRPPAYAGGLHPPHRPHRARRGDRAGDELRRARGTGPVARHRAASRPPRAAELKQKLATPDHDGRINKGRNDAPEDSRDGNRYREVVQRCEGLRLHHPGRWRGRLRALQRDPGAGLQEPRRG